MDISIVEFLVYGLIGYSGAIMIVMTAFREVPDQKAHSIARVIWLIPAMAAVFVLAGSGVNITLNDSTVSSVITNLNTTDTWSETVSTSDQITLLNPIWILFHSMLGLIMSIYIFTQLMNLFGKSK